MLLVLEVNLCDSDQEAFDPFQTTAVMGLGIQN